MSEAKPVAGPIGLAMRVVWGLSQAAAIIAAGLVAAMTLHILLEIVLRLLDRSTFVLDEMVGYAVAGATFLSLGYAFEHGALVRVGLLIDRFSDRPRRLIEALCGLLTCAIAAGIAQVIAKTALRSFERGRTSSSIAEIPLWIPEAICAIGLGIFALQVAAYVLRQLLGLPGPVAAPAQPSDL
ncbi:TRAP transporter small permease [Salipiger sp. 1_MG-2023]|uniref:TRAP transporter small permease subunit n=1 Tax=Salipiger sp. 1_MG-2023 TaxID=3062665 RepID=UPI0026E4095D|nr:TRAP transporter small permease [Salipiger sp. 1_MG-2023]MDO6586739.1 TRAP transporter small permease [Salipiger sp. 1_MG-2023]